MRSSISKSIWKELKKIHNLFLENYLAVCKTTPFSILLLAFNKNPLKILRMEGILRYINKIRWILSQKLLPIDN
jgi:hypothetical protein